jgi:hypothetical protein
MRSARVQVTATCLAMGLLASLASGSELSQLIAKANHVITLNRLGLTPTQLGALAPVAEEFSGTVKVWQANRQAALANARTDLQAARDMLLDGETLTPALQKAIADVEAELTIEDDTLYNTAVTVLGKVKDQLLPQQNAYIDWTPPRGEAAAARETLQQRAQRERDRRAMIALAAQFLTRIRYYPPFILGVENVVDDFLRPLIDPRSPDYPPARQFMLEMVREVRVMPEAQWEVMRDEYAVRMVRALGFEQPPPADEALQQKPYTWQDMYDIFSDPGTPALLRAVKQARTGERNP